MIGSEGVSRVFMLGVAHLNEPDEAHKRLEELRQGLLADPYFKGVPSMQPTSHKTAMLFHAKDDVPEVRREVFRLLPTLGVKVQVAIRRKEAMAREAQATFKVTGRKPSSNYYYDDLVKRLLRNLLHKAGENRITFARRGKSPRQAALEAAIESARKNFERKWGIVSDRPTRVYSAVPYQSAGLQIADYFLSALQRFYERGEDRYFNLLAPQFRLIMDLDDRHRRPYGEWYSDSNPLTKQKMKPATD